MLAPRLLAGLTLGVTLLAAGCQSLVGSEPTPVPGAAATLARGSRTPIPTPVRTPSPSPSLPVASPARSQPPPSPSAEDGGVTEEQVAQVRRALQQSLASPELPGIENLLFDQVDFATAEGGQVLERDEAARWLRDHAGPGLQVSRVDRNALAVVLQVLTEGWPLVPPVAEGRVTFNLHRYGPDGKQDDERGDWKVDIVGAE